MERVAVTPRTEPWSALLEAVEALRRRSLVERIGPGANFTLQPVVLEFCTDRLVETAASEIAGGQPALLLEQPVVFGHGNNLKPLVRIQRK